MDRIFSVFMYILCVLFGGLCMIKVTWPNFVESITFQELMLYTNGLIAFVCADIYIDLKIK